VAAIDEFYTRPFLEPYRTNDPVTDLRDLALLVDPDPSRQTLTVALLKAYSVGEPNDRAAIDLHWPRVGPAFLEWSRHRKGFQPPSRYDIEQALNATVRGTR